MRIYDLPWTGEPSTVLIVFLLPYPVFAEIYSWIALLTEFKSKSVVTTGDVYA